jgi:hypothetical protein
MKTALIVLVCLAVALGVISYFALFSGTQVIQPLTSNSTGQGSSTPTLVLPTSTASSSAPTTTTTATGASQTFAANFSAPYPVTWQEGQSALAVTGATLQANQLTLAVNIQLGATAECIPINLRMVTDEQGDMATPSAPLGANFPLASDGSCNVAPNAQYTSKVTFTIDPTTSPFIFTTGAPSNLFFEVTTTTGNGLQVDVPQQSG